MPIKAIWGDGAIAGLNDWNTMSWLWLLADTAAKKADDSKTKQILDFLHSNPMIGWGIAGFAVVAMAIAAIAKLTGDLKKIIEFPEYLSSKKSKRIEAQRQKAREDLIKILLKQVVTRLEDSLHHKIRIDLRREEQRQRVGLGNLASVQKEETEQVLDNFIKRTLKRFRGSTPPKTVSANKSTQELFDQEDIQGRLLILGEPGSGKTNELLVLAKDLLYQAQKSAFKPIPIIFELSEWDNEKWFADWLVQQLLDKYDLPTAVSEYWIKHNQILPLLDGLDELRWVNRDLSTTPKQLDEQRISRQIHCVRQINSFLDIYSLSLVVCCRSKEYEVIESQGEYFKRLNGAIYLQELEENQIQEYLKNLNRESVWNQIKSQPDLLRLAKSPLFLLILIVAYKNQKISCSDELLDEYINKQLYDLNNHGAYFTGKAPTPEKTHHYLSWLATKLDFSESTDFLIEDLQPSLIYSSENWEIYLWVIWLFILLITMLFTGSYFALIFWLNSWLLGGLRGGIENLNNSIWISEFNINDKLYPNQGIRNSIKKGIIVGLISGILVGLIVGLIYGLTWGLILALPFGKICGLVFGLFEAYQHLAIRIVLYRSGVSPWNYARFLEHAENHRFIQRVGGRYRFTHDLIRKRFAATYKKTNIISKKFSPFNL